jgi:hypothetical protein
VNKAFYILILFGPTFLFSQVSDTALNTIDLVNEDSLFVEYCKNSDLAWVMEPCRTKSAFNEISSTEKTPRSMESPNMALGLVVFLKDSAEVPIKKQKVRLLDARGTFYEEGETDEDGFIRFTKFSKWETVYLHLNKNGKCQELEFSFFEVERESRQYQITVYTTD